MFTSLTFNEVFSCERKGRRDFHVCPHVKCGSLWQQSKNVDLCGNRVQNVDLCGNRVQNVALCGNTVQNVDLCGNTVQNVASGISVVSHLCYNTCWNDS